LQYDGIHPESRSFFEERFATYSNPRHQGHEVRYFSVVANCAPDANEHVVTDSDIRGDRNIARNHRASTNTHQASGLEIRVQKGGGSASVIDEGAGNLSSDFSVANRNNKFGVKVFHHRDRAQERYPNRIPSFFVGTSVIEGP